MYRMLIAEDEAGIRESIKEFFGNKNFDVIEATDGLEATQYVIEEEFDIVLLDVMMPEMDGFQVCRVLRKKSDTPVIFLTARVAEEDQLKGFQLQADDYITKPFSLPVLHAKVNAIIQRNKGMIAANILGAEGIWINTETREVKVDGVIVEMPNKVYSLLVYLMENRNRILTRDQILNHVWGDEAQCFDRAVDTTIKKLRHHLGKRAGCIKTIIKVGYKFEDEK